MRIFALNPKNFYAGWPERTDFGHERYQTPSLMSAVLKRPLRSGHEMRCKAVERKVYKYFSGGDYIPYRPLMRSTRYRQQAFARGESL